MTVPQNHDYPELNRRKRGAPFGNQNARKHGYYSRVITAEDRRSLKQAATVRGVDQEINLLRVKLRSVLKHDPDNVRLFLQAIVSLARLLRTRKSIGGDAEERLGIAIQNVIRDIGVPLGLDPRFLLRKIADPNAPET